MLVREMIVALQSFDQDLPLVFATSDCGDCGILNIYSHDGPETDPKSKPLGFVAIDLDNY